MSVADKSGSKIKRKPKVNSLGLKYREPRLIHYNWDPTRKWYIIFYIEDIGQGRVVRKRMGKDILNKVTNLDERKKEALSQMRSLSDALKKGWLDTPKKREEVRAFDFHGYKFLNALDYVINFKQDIEKRKKNTIHQYNYTKNVIYDFMEHEGISENMLLRMLNKSFVDKLTIYIKEKGLSNKTHNGVVTSLHSMVEKLRSLDDHLFKDKNPVRVVKLPVVTNTHAAYSLDQLQKFTKAIEPHDPQLLLFIRCIYFSLARPKELTRMKVGDIFLSMKRIKITGSNAKSSKEKYVGISDRFEKIIIESGVLNYPEHFYVFTASGKPGEKPVGENYFYKRFRPYMDKLNFKQLNERYTMYSFKHSGAIQLFLDTKDLSLVQMQCRHDTPDQTSVYLKELGIYTNFDALNGWKGF